MGLKADPGRFLSHTWTSSSLKWGHLSTAELVSAAVRDLGLQEMSLNPKGSDGVVSLRLHEEHQPPMTTALHWTNSQAQCLTRFCHSDHPGKSA